MALDVGAEKIGNLRWQSTKVAGPHVGRPGPGFLRVEVATLTGRPGPKSPGNCG